MSGRAKDSIDLGLAISGLTLLHGETRTNEEMAAYCGCSPQRIQQICEGGLRKLRNRFLFTKDPLIKEAVETLLKR